jgi:type I restriction enzyme S subunit
MKYKLGDICTITKGNTGIMKAIDGEYTMVTLGEENKTHNEYQFDTKAVIIPLVSSTGHGHASMKRVKYMEGKFALGTILCAVIPNDETFVLAKYLQIYLHQNREKLLVSLMKGAANVGLSIKKIYYVEVLVPNMATQLKVVKLEQKINESDSKLISLFSKQQSLLNLAKQSILQDAIQGKLTEEWRKQNPKTESANILLKRIKAEKEKLIAENKIKKEKPLPAITKEEIPFELPEGWVWCRFLDLVHYRKGKKPNILVTKKDAKYNIPYIDIAAFEKGVISNYTNDKKAVFCTKENILLVWDGARIGLVGKNVEGAVGSTLAKIDVIELNVDFVYLLLQSKFTYFNQNQKQAGLPHIDGSLLDNLLIALPSLSEQQIIVEKVELLLQKCEALSKEIAELEKQGRHLLKAMFHEVFAME